MFGDATWTPMTVSPENAQFLETRRYMREEICGLYGVPLQRIQAIVDNASQGGGKGLDAIDAGYVKHGLLPAVSPIERAWSRLLPGDQPRGRRSTSTSSCARTPRSAPLSRRSTGWRRPHHRRDPRRGLRQEPLPNGQGRTRSRRSTRTRRRPAALTTHRPPARYGPVKIRRGGLREFEQRVLDGDVRAVRALVRQASGPNTLELPFRDVELRAAPDGTGGSRLLFTGYASVSEQPYQMQDWLGPYTEIVRNGAFTKTLSESPDVIFCLNHYWDGAPMARTKPGTLRLTEDTTGLLTEADIDGKRADVYQVQSAMEAGELDAMSFAFWVVRQSWSPDYEQRDILEIDLDGGDTSVVTWPANPHTTGTTGLRKRAAAALARSNVPTLLVQRARAEKRAGAKLSSATMETLQEVLDLIAEADQAVDVAQQVLSELMGVPNPDDDAAGITETDDTAGETESGPAPDAVRERLQLQELARR
jgi:HK97 family phage prohead protease